MGKLLRKIIIGIFIVSAVPGVVWGVITGDAHKGTEVYVKTFNYLFEPVGEQVKFWSDRRMAKAQRKGERIQKALQTSLQIN
jgi:hypothetical protein